MLDETQSPFELLNRVELHCVCLLLKPQDVARLCCTSRWLLAACSDDFLWSRFCERTWLLAAPVGPVGKQECRVTRWTLSPFHAAYGSWFAEYGQYADIYARGHAAVSIIREFASKVPQIASTLQPGASERTLDELGTQYEFELSCKSLRLVWRLLGGQVRPAGSRTFPWQGLFGAFQVYDHATSLWMWPLDKVGASTVNVRRFLSPDAARRPWVVFAGVLTMRESRFLLVDAANGDVKLMSTSEELQDATPLAPQGDGILRWMESFASRCASGDISIERAVPEDPATLCISPFPRLPPLLSECVTNGVRIQASAVMAPDLTEPTRGIAFVYRIRFSLLAEEEQQRRGGKVVRSVQLRNRHWIITDGSGQTSEVSGDAVIGLFPLLTAGGPVFVYQSMTYHHGPGEGSMRGFFGFVEGSLQAPLSGLFHAECSSFPLRVPEYYL